jgi:hypothetical protein
LFSYLHSTLQQPGASLAIYFLSLAKEWHSILAGMECAIPFWPE